MIGQHIDGNLEGIESEPEIEVIEDAIVQKEHEEDTTKVDCDEIEYYDSDDHDEQKKVTEILVGNFNDEFELLWDYANELRAKNPSSTIKMAVKRKKESESYEFSFWEIVKATIEKESEDKFEAPFKKDEKAAMELKSKSPKHWTKAFFECHSKFDMVGVRVIPIKHNIGLGLQPQVWGPEALVVRYRLHKWNPSWKQNYGLLVKRKFDQNKKCGVQWQIVWNDDNGCEKLATNWLTMYTCLFCLRHMGGEPDDYVDQYYQKEMYMKAYVSWS
ncbi:hypothetical protein Gogos_019538 [Gossypium gossypioides]|uniref:Uncharacterized protein n=1 Tax=Gossypium gossypioides TaxID=34282 RepID=A0A7J9BHT4_GOSGO|nr:hypothetical protein [Gossypium gossypioides]